MNEMNLQPCPFCDEDEHLKVMCGGGVCPHCGESLGHWYCVCESCGATSGTFNTLELDDVTRQEFTKLEVGKYSAKELAILAENHGTSCGRQIAGCLIDEMEKFLRMHDEEKENS